MVYRRNRRRRYPQVRRNWGNSAWSAMKMASTALSVAKGVKGLLNVENKYLDTTATSSVTQTGLMTHLTAIAEGDGQSARTGVSVKMKGILCRDLFKINSSATFTYVRLIHFMWFDDDAPTGTDLLDSDDWYSQFNREKSNKYKILLDKTIMLDLNGKGTYFNKKYHKLGKHLKFDGATGSDYETGSIWSYVVSDQNTNTPSRDGRYRVTYIDN